MPKNKRPSLHEINLVALTSSLIGKKRYSAIHMLNTCFSWDIVRRVDRDKEAACAVLKLAWESVSKILEARYLDEHPAKRRKASL